MQIAQIITIPVSLDETWRALNDPEVLRQSLPDCDSFEATGEDQFDFSVRAKVGPMSVRFSGEIALEDVIPKKSYRLTGSGKGGTAGRAKGSVKVQVEPLTETTTRLTYIATANISGKLAQVGARLIDGAAKKMAGDFFARFIRLLCQDESLEIISETIEISQQDV